MISRIYSMYQNMGTTVGTEYDAIVEWKSIYFVGIIIIQRQGFNQIVSLRTQVRICQAHHQYNNESGFFHLPQK